MTTPSTHKRKPLRFRLLWIALPVSLFLFLLNASFLASPEHNLMLFAHRGLAQDFSREGLTGTTCTAAQSLPTEHTYLENTITSMEAAFNYGADFVELDVHLTRDDSFAVFHDWTLDCRTNGSGTTHEQTMPHLRSLDIGYGYTMDQGASWPYRGQGVEKMPSLTQVLTHFPDQNFVIDIKTNNTLTGTRLADRLGTLASVHNGELVLTGGPVSVKEASQKHRHLKTITRPQLKNCLIGYVALGWTSHVPASCSNSLLTIPVNIAPWLWGWPNRFIQRMEGAGSYVTLLGPYKGEGFSNGVNEPSMLERLPDNYRGGIWTDRIDLIAPALDQ